MTDSTDTRKNSNLDSKTTRNENAATTASNTSSCPYALNYGTPITSTSSTPASSSPIMSSSLISENKNLTPMQALQLAKTSCPAFKSECPFRNVHDANGMREALKTLPASHVNNSSLFESHPGTGSIDASNGNGAKANNAENKNPQDCISESLKVALTHVHAVSQSLSHHSPVDDIDMEESASERERVSDGDVHAQDGNDDGTKSRRRSSSFSITGGCPFKTQYKSGTTFVDAMEELSLFGMMAKVIIKMEDDPILAQQSVLGNVAADTASSDVTPTESSPNGSAEGQSSMKRVRSHTSLSNALKEGTAKSHSAAESVHFVKEFIKGNIDRDLYSILILNLFYVYEVLERALDEHAPRHFSTLYFPKELKRTETLRDDVDFYLGVDVMEDLNHQEKYKPSKATLDYMRRVDYIAETEPLLLLSHAYTRYLGDLSGGKVLARVARRALKLQDKDSGLAFYNFNHIPSAKLFKDEYRRALDELDLTDEEIERLVAEANVAFVLNMRIFEELDVLSGIEGSSVRDYKEAIKYYDDCIQAQKNNKNGNDPETCSPNIEQEQNQMNKCPFAMLGGPSPPVEKEQNQINKCPFAMLGGPNPHKTSTSSLTANADTNDSSSKLTSNDAAAKNSQEKIERNTLSNASVVVKSTKDTSIDMGKNSTNEARCPWPFVFFHDPQTGMRDWQTWAVIGLVLCLIWNKLQKCL